MSIENRDVKVKLDCRQLYQYKFGMTFHGNEGAKPDALSSPFNAVSWPTHAIAMAQELQRHLVELGPSWDLGIAALELIGFHPSVNGSRRLYIHTSAGYVLNRGLTFAESIQEVEVCSDFRVAGWFGGIKYVQEDRLRSLCADIYDPIIFGIDDDASFDGSFTAPLLIPVCSIEDVILAA
ncbi:hypothetical protein HY346_02340 [Candidatus Microgenomates bacterium]|nr:hypothetical protein [Candidatus Microgenomates bacterium]